MTAVDLVSIWAIVVMVLYAVKQRRAR